MFSDHASNGLSRFTLNIAFSFNLPKNSSRIFCAIEIIVVE